ncbi:hypothetical protein Efla_007330 [Eimeria flavescens]
MTPRLRRACGAPLLEAGCPSFFFSCVLLLLLLSCLIHRKLITDESDLLRFSAESARRLRALLNSGGPPLSAVDSRIGLLTERLSLEEANLERRQQGGSIRWVVSRELGGRVTSHPGRGVCSSKAISSRRPAACSADSFGLGRGFFFRVSLPPLPLPCLHNPAARDREKGLQICGFEASSRAPAS